MLYVQKYFQSIMLAWFAMRSVLFNIYDSSKSIGSHFFGKRELLKNIVITSVENLALLNEIQPQQLHKYVFYHLIVLAESCLWYGLSYIFQQEKLDSIGWYVLVTVVLHIIACLLDHVITYYRRKKSQNFYILF